MIQCMNALADKVHKQEVPCTQWYALYNMHDHIQQPSATYYGDLFLFFFD